MIITALLIILILPTILAGITVYALGRRFPPPSPRPWDPAVDGPAFSGRRAGDRNRDDDDAIGASHG